VTDERKLPQREAQSKSDVQHAVPDKTVQPRVSQKSIPLTGTMDKAPVVRQPDQKGDLDKQMQARVRGQERTKNFDSLRNAQTAATPGDDAKSRTAANPRSTDSSKDSAAGPKDKGSSASSRDSGRDSKDSTTSSSRDSGDKGSRGGSDRNR